MSGIELYFLIGLIFTSICFIRAVCFKMNYWNSYIDKQELSRINREWVVAIFIGVMLILSIVYIIVWPIAMMFEILHLLGLFGDLD